MVQSDRAAPKRLAVVLPEPVEALQEKARRLAREMHTKGFSEDDNPYVGVNVKLALAWSESYSKQQVMVTMFRKGSALAEQLERECATELTSGLGSIEEV